MLVIGRHGYDWLSAYRASNQACTNPNRTYGFWTGGAVWCVLERQGGSSACAWLADACVIPLDIRYKYHSAIACCQKGTLCPPPPAVAMGGLPAIFSYFFELG